MTDTPSIDPDTATTDRVRTLPAWLSVLLILLCLAAGGGFLYWYFAGDVLSRTTVIIPKEELDKQRAEAASAPERQRWARGQLNISDPDGLHAQPGDGGGSNAQGSWTVKAGDAAATARRDASGRLSYRFTYLRTDLLSPDQYQTMVATWRLTRDEAMAKAVALTPDQLVALRNEAASLGIIMSPEDRSRVEGQFKIYFEATTDPARNEAVNQIVSAMKEISPRQFEPTRKQMVERVERIRTLLTPEQWEAWKKTGG